MGLIESNKTVSKQRISGEETFKVKLSLQSSPNIRENPKNIALLLDRSGSLSGEPIIELKKGVNHFLDVIDKSTDGIQDSVIGSGSKIGIVSFATDATIDSGLSTDVVDIKSAVDAMVTSGSTNHEDAFRKGIAVLSTPSTNKDIMVIFTDGQSNRGQEGYALADDAKAKGIEIYCVAFGHQGNLDIDMLNRWASAPVGEHVLITPDYHDIEAMFDGLAARISEPKATDIVLEDTISPCFEIVSKEQPTRGTATIINDRKVRWMVDAVGDKDDETVEFEFTVRHIGGCNGVVEVNESYDYKDSENNFINLPKPTILIYNNSAIYVEDCPIAQDITAEGCHDYIEYNAGDITIDGLGRVVQVSANIKSVCPNKRVALAVILSEVDVNGVEQDRGMKTLVIPAHGEATCKDILVRCIKFVLPESLDMTGSTTSLCNARHFKARFIANYLDSDYNCCQ